MRGEVRQVVRVTAKPPLACTQCRTQSPANPRAMAAIDAAVRTLRGPPQNRGGGSRRPVARAGHEPRIVAFDA